MSDASCLRTALYCLWNSVWTPVMTVAFLIFLATRDVPTAPRAVAHSDACRACASTAPEARALRDALLIQIGAIEAPTAPDSLSEGADLAVSAALSRPGAHENQCSGRPGADMVRPAS
jgi:hypothetical protein